MLVVMRGAGDIATGIALGTGVALGLAQALWGVL